MTDDTLKKALIANQVLIDITEMLANPTTTGIQRVTKEVCLYWPEDNQLVPYRVISETEIAIIDPGAIDAVVRYFDSTGDDVIGQCARELSAFSNRIDGPFLELLEYGQSPLMTVEVAAIADSVSAFVCLELFGEVERANFYKKLAKLARDKIFVLAYDFLLWLRPETFPNFDWRFGHGLLEYTNALAQLKHIGFIARPNLEEFEARVNRRSLPTYRNLMLGTDSLGAAPPSDTFEEAMFVVAGTIEPRKQPMRVLKAFERLAGQNRKFTLHFCGKIGWISEEERQVFDQALEKYDWLHHHSNLNDSDMGAVIRRAAAMVYFSMAEGFGLPPVESLSLGVPIIVSDDMPSIVDLPDKGMIRVPVDDDAALEKAIIAYCDRSFALKKRHEIDQSALVTWRGWVAMVAEWVESATDSATAALVPAEYRSQGSIPGRLRHLEAFLRVRASNPRDSVIGAFQLVFGKIPSGGQIKQWRAIADTCHLGQQEAAILLLADAARRNVPLDYPFMASLLGNAAFQVPEGLFRLRDWRASEARLKEIANQALKVVRMSGAEFARSAYPTFLGRDAGPKEAEAHASVTSQEAAWRRLREILASEEFGHRQSPIVTERVVDWTDVIGKLEVAIEQYDDENFIITVFQSLLGRYPDGGEISVRMTLLMNGQQRSVITLGICLSWEYITKTKDLGLLRYLVHHLAARLPKSTVPIKAVAEVKDISVAASLRTLAIESLEDGGLDQVTATQTMDQMSALLARARVEPSEYDALVALPAVTRERDILPQRSEGTPPITPVTVALLANSVELKSLVDTPVAWRTIARWVFSQGLQEFGFAPVLSHDQWRWLLGPDPDVSQPSPIPLSRHAMILWSMRPDLQEAFDTGSDDGRKRLARWYWLWGVAEYKTAGSMPAEAVDPLLARHPSFDNKAGATIIEFELWLAMDDDFRDKHRMNSKAGLAKFRTWLSKSGVQSFPIIERAGPNKRGRFSIPLLSGAG